jgi:MoaA/NifB/PqqE/SkfB family radical SAM enzyme
MIAWDHWHIELSSICALQCPRCPRAEVPDTLLNRQLSLDFFKNRIGQHQISQMRKITFCGNDGDPIYCRDFLEICAWIKHINPGLHLTIITNGSYKPRAWWIELANVLNQHDEIQWSIDGWDQASNSQYRRNCDWDSIVLGQKTFAEHNNTTYRIWATIAFRFNQDQLDSIENLARSTGMDSWQLTLSTKFGSRYPEQYGQQDPLEPTVSNLVSSESRFERRITQLTDKTRPELSMQMLFQQRHQAVKNYHAVCMIGNKGVFLNSQGELYPCCWVANRYDHNNIWHTRAKEMLNLYHRRLEYIIEDQFWSSPEFLNFQSYECQTKCTADRWQDREHVTQW